MTFHNFSLENDEKSNCDSSAQGARLTITNVASDDGRNPFQLCGQTIPHPVYSTGSEITMTLESASNQVAGFNASYETVTDEMCKYYRRYIYPRFVSRKENGNP